jgi:beta-lactamase class D
MSIRTLFVFCSIVLLSSCAETRIHEKEEWGTIFKQNGISDGCFIIRDHTHESIYYYNKDRCLKRYTPASTFKIFNSLVGLETAIAPDEQYVIKWDSVKRWRDEWNRDMNMREAFKESNVGYYQELARRIGKDYMQHYLDTVQYGNRMMGDSIDGFWLNNKLQISADEQTGFVKRLYFDELPFAERSQRIVRSMMLQEQTKDFKLYYKTGTADLRDSTLYWIVGFAERTEEVKEHEKSMNKSNVRNYPYFFAQNFSVAHGDTSRNWFKTRVEVLHQLLQVMEVLPPGK